MATVIVQHVITSILRGLRKSIKNFTSIEGIRTILEEFPITLRHGVFDCGGDVSYSFF